MIAKLRIDTRMHAIKKFLFNFEKFSILLETKTQFKL